MVQDLAERASGDTKKLREFFVLEAAHVALGDVSRSGPDRVAQLVRELELPLEVGTPQELINTNFELVGEMQREDVVTVVFGGKQAPRGGAQAQRLEVVAADLSSRVHP